MSDSGNRTGSAQEHALVVCQPGRLQQVIAGLGMLILRYRYGLEVVKVDRPAQALTTAHHDASGSACILIVWDESVASPGTFYAMARDGEVPVILALPKAAVAPYRAQLRKQADIAVCSWDDALGTGDDSLAAVVEAVFARRGIGDLYASAARLGHEEFMQRMAHRVRHVALLPTLPQVVAQVLQAADAPAAAAELDQILPYDPALLCWLLHTAGGPVFAAGPGPLGWSLQQTVERLGAREVGLAAQQIRFYNTAVRAHLGRFDLRRFWAHSAACALVADWLVRVRRLRLPGPVEFSDYWPSALLHDIGRLALGYVFPERLAAIHEGLNGSGVSFRQAERQLGEIGNHEELAGLLALNAGLPGSVVEAIRRHHSPGEQAPPLVCLIHLADHLCKAIGLSCMANEPSGCNPFVLDRVGVPLADLSRMADELRGRDSVTGRVMALVQRFGGNQYSNGAGPTPCGTCGSGG